MTKSTAKTDRPSDERRRPRSLGAVAALLLVAAACSSSDTAQAVPPAAPSQSAPQTPATTAQPAAPTTTPPTEGLAPEEILTDALATYASGYEFTAVASVNGEVATTIDGRWLAGASELSIASGDGEVDYLITATGQWTRLADGPWQELDGVPPVGNPLTALAQPSSLETAEAVVGNMGLLAVYPGAILGFPEGSVEVMLTLRDALLTQATYHAVIDGVNIETVTTFAPLEDTSPITAPSQPGG